MKNIMFVGAHPDDCDFGCGGMALKFVDAGHRVLFLSMTDGRLGHHINPSPFKADVAINIDDVMEKKTAMLNCHVSQVYEWLPYVESYADDVPPAEDEKGRFSFLKTKLEGRDAKAADYCRELLLRQYGKEKGNAIMYCEAMQLCEYGAQPAKGDISDIFTGDSYAR